MVEDDLVVLAVALRMLDRAGYRTLAAASRDEALDVAATADLSAVVVDVVLPRYDGRVLVDELRARSPHLPAVLVSGHDRAVAVGRATVFLPKPFTPTQLVAALENVLDG